METGKPLEQMRSFRATKDQNGHELRIGDLVHVEHRSAKLPYDIAQILDIEKRAVAHIDAIRVQYLCASYYTEMIWADSVEHVTRDQAMLKILES